MFLTGFICGLILIAAILPWAFSIKTQNKIVRKTNAFKSQSVISFAFIIPIMIMALVFSVIVGSRITRELANQGHGEFIFFSLVFPVFSFLIGYLFLKKQVLK